MLCGGLRPRTEEKRGVRRPAAAVTVFGVTLVMSSFQNGRSCFTFCFLILGTKTNPNERVIARRYQMSVCLLM
jgi:hypothetical protein